jgi:hypothetical protein
MKDKIFLCKLIVNKIYNDKALLFVGDAAFIADIRPSQRVVPCDHHTAYLSLL